MSPKNDNRQKVEQFRPITLLEVTGKVLESPLRTLLEQVKLSPEHHGFSKGRGTDTKKRKYKLEGIAKLIEPADSGTFLGLKIGKWGYGDHVQDRKRMSLRVLESLKSLRTILDFESKMKLVKILIIPK